MADQKHVVIVGAGFGGVRLAKELAKENVHITLVDRHNYHLFQPLLYQLATSLLSTDEIAYPIRVPFSSTTTTWTSSWRRRRASIRGAASC